MAYKHVTTAAATSISGACSRVLITVNAALTGTLTVTDDTGSGTGATVGIITNPTVGGIFEYWDLKLGCTVTPSGTCEITVNTTGQYGSK